MRLAAHCVPLVNEWVTFELGRWSLQLGKKKLTALRMKLVAKRVTSAAHRVTFITRMMTYAPQTAITGFRRIIPQQLNLASLKKLML